MNALNRRILRLACERQDELAAWVDARAAADSALAALLSGEGSWEEVLRTREALKAAGAAWGKVWSRHSYRESLR